jgi:hypothetical protein
MKSWSLIVLFAVLAFDSNYQGTNGSIVEQKSKVQLKSKFLDDNMVIDSDIVSVDTDLNDDYTSISHLEEVKNIIQQKDKELELEK